MRSRRSCARLPNAPPALFPLAHCAPRPRTGARGVDHLRPRGVQRGVHWGGHRRAPCAPPTTLADAARRREGRGRRNPRPRHWRGATLAAHGTRERQIARATAGIERRRRRRRSDRRRWARRPDGVAAVVAGWRALAARRAPRGHGRASQGARHQRAQHGDLPPLRHRGRDSRGGPCTRAHRPRPLDANLERGRDRTPRPLAVERTEPGGEPGAQLPLRPGRP
jgi:hypothetical protein